MTMQEAIALQPAWVGHWLKVLFICAYILPFALLIWKQSRWPAILLYLLNIPGVAIIMWMYQQMGHVKLLGLPHIRSINRTNRRSQSKVNFWINSLQVASWGEKLFLNIRKHRLDLGLKQKKVSRIIGVTAMIST